MVRLSVPGARKPSSGASRRGHGAVGPGGATAATSPHFAVLVTLILSAFLFGGGSRGDIVSLVILRPLAALACGYALLTLDSATIRANRALFGLFGAMVLLLALHLVPMPPAMWHLLPGREVIAAIDRAAGLGEVWRPLTFVPSAGWNALFALLVPLAALLLGVQCSPAALDRLLPLLLVLCLVSGLLGVLQMIGPGQGPLYFYRITNNGAAVGLFSNRNHAAVFLACYAPMAATWIAAAPAVHGTGRRRLILASAGLALIVPLIVAAGSRAGLLIGAVGLVAAAAILHKARLGSPARADLKRFGGGAAALALALSAVFFVFSRGQAVERLSAADQGEDLRFQAWGTVFRGIREFMPFGSGAGSFAESYQIFEPDALLSPSYFNHAHNDFLEVAMTLGLPGLGLIGFAVWLWLFGTWRAWRDGGASRARLGAVLLGLLILASSVDYPLRVPSLAVFAVIAALWLRPGLEQPGRIASGSDTGIRARAVPGSNQGFGPEFSKDFHAAG